MAAAHLEAAAGRLEVSAEEHDERGDPLGAMLLRYRASMLRARATHLRRLYKPTLSVVVHAPRLWSRPAA